MELKKVTSTVLRRVTGYLNQGNSVTWAKNGLGSPRYIDVIDHLNQGNRLPGLKMASKLLLKGDVPCYLNQGDRLPGQKLTFFLFFVLLHIFLLKFYLEKTLNFF